MSEDLYNLYTFAYCRSDEGFNNMLEYLSNIAEDEVWGSNDNKFSILRRYIFKTFRQCNLQGKILYSNDNEFCCCNTGLLTKNSKDILMVFEENNKESDKKWVLKGFWDKTRREYMEHFNGIPDLATYTKDFKEFYFDPSLNIEVNTDHILDDNWDRVSAAIGCKNKKMVYNLLISSVEEAKIKVKRNMRLVVPQLYKDKIMYLMPIEIPCWDEDGQSIVLALAIEKTETNQYRANTIFTKETAYEKARLLMKPEANWLIDK